MKTNNLIAFPSILIGSILLLGSSSSCSRDVLTQSKTKFIQGTATYSATTAQGSPIRIVLQSSQLAANSPYQHVDFWGGPQGSSVWAVTNLEVAINGESVLLPFSAYSNMANVNDVKVAVKPDGFEIDIDGGETGEHYKSVLSFDSAGVLKKRRVYSTNFSDEAWEETSYSFIPANR